MSDEIGHFENCLKLDAQFNCAVPGKQDAGGLDEDDGNLVRWHAVSSVTPTASPANSHNYDATGNAIGRPGQTITYNSEGHLHLGRLS